MTSAPSTSLHVLPPQPADIMPSLDHPPTPLTPKTLNSAMSSRAQLSEESTYPPVAQPSPTLKGTSHQPVSDMSGSAAAQEQQKPGHEPYTSIISIKQTTTEVDEVSEVPTVAVGLKCAPPDMLPPSPPPTVAEAHDDPSEVGEYAANAASTSSTQPGRSTVAPSALSGMLEEDITDRRASMHREEGAEEDGEPSGDGEYDPYDLGYSPDPTPITPVGPSTHAGEARVKEYGSLLEARDHPLRQDVHSPSPPPWEIVDPPHTTVQMRTAGSRVPNTVPKPATSRPLIPHSAYYFGPPPVDSAYGTDPIGQLGVHHPREIIRIERDYSGGELVQFAASYPLELEGRITPTQFLETINAINERLIEAHSLSRSFIDNALAFFTLQLSRFVITSQYEKEMQRLRQLIDDLNKSVYNPVGLNILWPRKVAFMFLEIEYY